MNESDSWSIKQATLHSFVCFVRVLLRSVQVLCNLNEQLSRIPIISIYLSLGKQVEWDRVRDLHSSRKAHTWLPPGLHWPSWPSWPGSPLSTQLDSEDQLCQVVLGDRDEEELIRNCEIHFIVIYRNYDDDDESSAAAASWVEHLARYRSIWTCNQEI